MKDIENMGIDEIFEKLRKIRNHQVHAAKYHPTKCEALIQRGRRYGELYKRKLMQKYSLDYQS